LNTQELFTALAPVADVLERLGIAYYVGGSIASSAYGVARASVDVDIVADLQHGHVAAFASALRDAFYLDEGRIQSAITSRRSFNLIHLPRC
jgi:hypothetical protein